MTDVAGDIASVGVPTGVIVRDARRDDIAAITEIYRHWVENGTASFELTAPDQAEMLRRYQAIRSDGKPYLCAEGPDSAILGYAYAGAYRPRRAYRHSVEDSIYVAPGINRQGVGRALLSTLIERCRQDGYHQMIAVIGDSASHGSIGLHSSLGFRHIGTLERVGHKFGRWLDSVFMQLELTDRQSPSIEP